MALQNLIQELLNPQTNLDGSIVPPSVLKLRAAETIKQVYTLQQQDLKGRLIAEQDAQRNLAQAMIYRELYDSTDPADQYQCAMNKDQDESFN